MVSINSVQTPVIQTSDFRGINKNNTIYSKTSEAAHDTVCFKGLKSKDSFNFFKKILGLTTAGAVGATAVEITKEKPITKTKEIKEKTNSEWNTNSRGYKILDNAGFSSELINSTINRMKKEEVDSLINGLEKIYIKNSEGPNGIIKGIYNALNDDLKDDEKSAELTFKLLAEILKRSKDDRIYLYGVYASIKYEGVKAFEKGVLSDGGIWGDNFTFYDKEGNDLASDRIRESFDSKGNKIIEKVDCDGNVSKDGKKYDINDRLLEEWDEFTRTEYHYNEKGVLYEKVKHMACATETLTLVNGEWKSDKEDAWRDW